MKRVIRKDKIFIFVSILFLLTLFIVYGYRLVHYYRLENKKEVVNTTVSKPVSFYEHLLTYLPSEDEKLSVFNSSLKQDSDGKSYYFTGGVLNNYIYYSGRLWRIVKINEDKSISLVSSEVQTLLPYGEEADYSKSYIYNYLNEVDENSLFYNNLGNTDLLINSSFCEDYITDLENLSCDKINNDYKITLLNLEDYLNSGGSDGFLNIGSYFWLMNFNEDEELYYVFDKGGVNTTDDYNTLHYGVRPVITISGDMILSSGDGTLENPYYLDSYESYKLVNLGVSEYLEYNNQMWRIIDKTDDAVKVALEGYIKEDEKDVEKVFSTKNNSFEVSKNYNVLYYLNNDYYNSFEEKEYMVKGKFYNGKYETDSYDYRLVYEDSVDAYVGLLQVGDLYINSYPGVLTSLAISDHMNNILYVINENNALYTSKINQEQKIRPVIYLDGNLIALSGEGTIDSPYIIGR